MSKTNPPALKERERIEQRLALICADYRVNLTHVIRVATEMDTRSGEKDVEQGGADDA